MIAVCLKDEMIAYATKNNEESENDVRIIVEKYNTLL